jgi:hypothetical protein
MAQPCGVANKRTTSMCIFDCVGKGGGGDFCIVVVRVVVVACAGSGEWREVRDRFNREDKPTEEEERQKR